MEVTFLTQIPFPASSNGLYDIPRQNEKQTDTNFTTLKSGIKTGWWAHPPHFHLDDMEVTLATIVRMARQNMGQSTFESNSFNIPEHKGSELAVIKVEAGSLLEGIFNNKLVPCKFW